MEIHAPDHPITSWKDLFLHLGIVTIGILIALGLESLVEWKHHRNLAAEARENILAEVRDNRRELSEFLADVPGTMRDQRKILGMIDDLLAKRKLDLSGEIHLRGRATELSDVSWMTAQATGALGFMPYKDIKSYSGVYELQAEYVRLERRNVDTIISAMNAFESKSDPTKLSESELREERDKILNSLANLTAEVQMGQQLNTRYDSLSQQ